MASTSLVLSSWAETLAILGIICLSHVTRPDKQGIQDWDEQVPLQAPATSHHRCALSLAGSQQSRPPYTGQIALPEYARDQRFLDN